MKKLINNIFGEKFEYEVVEKEYVDVLAAGYIITPEGEFIEVKDDNSHGDVFSKYLAKYLKESVVKYYETIKATGKLISLNHIVYLGIKTIDMKEIYKNSGQNNGYGILIIPDNYQETMTFEQKEACLRLINTNKSLFGNYEKIELSINKISSEEKLDKEEFTKYLIEKEVLKSLH